jgi:hypothetical protein
VAIISEAVRPTPPPKHSVGKLEPAFDPIKAQLYAVDLARLVHIAYVLARNVAFDRCNAQIEMPKLFDQAIDLAINAPQIFENEVLRFFSHWSDPLCRRTSQ